MRRRARSVTWYRSVNKLIFRHKWFFIFSFFFTFFFFFRVKRLSGKATFHLFREKLVTKESPIGGNVESCHDALERRHLVCSQSGCEKESEVSKSRVCIVGVSLAFVRHGTVFQLRRQKRRHCRRLLVSR